MRGHVSDSANADVQRRRGACQRQDCLQAGGFYRIRHYGLLANGSCKVSLNLVRELLNAPTVVAMPTETSDLTTPTPTFVCWHCGCAMLILQTFTRGHGPAIRAPPLGPTG